VINAGEWVFKHSIRKPEAPAVIIDDKRFTYAELNRRVNRLANTLAGLGVREGDRAAILSFNSNEYIEFALALAKLGAIIVPLNFRLTPPELEYILNDSGAKVMLFGPEFSGVCEELRGRVGVEHYIALGGEAAAVGAPAYEELLERASDAEPPLAQTGIDTPLIVMYTSGTTGRPKGAILTHGNTLFASLNAIQHGNSAGPILICIPMFHVAGLSSQALPAIYRGQPIVFQRFFDPERALQIIERERVSAMLVVPAVLLFMSQVSGFRDYDLSSVESFFVGGAPCPLSILRTYLERNIKIRQGFGMTESTGSGIVLDPEDGERKLGSCGKPMFHCNARVWDANGVEVAPNETGELMLRGPIITKGYWNLPEQTKAAFTDGWFHTGDIARMDEEGYIYVVDRMKDMLITGGENVYPAEVEEVIMAHPKVAEVGVIGVPDERWGESVRAIVVPLPGQELTAEDIQQFCAGKLARYKIPKSVVFMDALPRNPAGKILKRILREQSG
jgi:fatty-acyl-CoA synthase